MRPVLVVVALTVLLAPAAAAAPLEFDVDPARALELGGPGLVAGGRAVLDLTDAVRVGAPLRIEAADAVGERVSYQREGVETVLARNGSIDVEPLGSASAVFSDFSCGPSCLVLLLSDGRGEVGVAGTLRGGLTLTHVAQSYCGPDCGDGPPHFSRVVAAGEVVASSGQGEGLRVDGGIPHAQGDVVLFLRDVRCVIEDASGRWTLDARDERSTAADPLPATSWVERHARLDLASVQVAGRPGDPVSLFAAAPRVDVQGVLASSEASGVVSFGGQRTTFEREPIRFEGAFSLVLSAAADDASRVTAVVSPAARSVGGGDAMLVRIGTRSTAAPEGAAAVDVAATLGGLALLLSLLALLPRWAALPLYSKLSAARVLGNENRARILALLREDPGISIAALSRRTAVARIVVRHHLHVLESHGLVVSQRQAAARWYFPAEAASMLPQHASRVSLGSTLRRRIAEELARAGVTTQADVARATGASQRLTSYHLARMAKEGLVRVEGGRPKRYTATARLKEALAPAGHHGHAVSVDTRQPEM